MGRPDKAACAAIARRRSDAIDLRLAGVDWLTIARKLAADPTVNSDGIAYPQGYGIERYRKNQDPPTNEALIFGEPLWPARFDAAHHAKTRKRVGERVWGALYMQKPRPPEGGVWKREWINSARINAVQFSGLDMARIVVAVDPAGGESTVGDETGVIGLGRDFDRQLYVLADRSGSMGANDWGLAACRLALELKADAIVVEKNYGGDMARQIVTQAWEQLRREGVTKGLLMPMILEVTAKVGKRLRAAPMAQLYEQQLVHHVGEYPELEDQMVTWVEGMDSPDRMDAAVHGLTELADPDQLDTLATDIDDDRFDGRR